MILKINKVDDDDFLGSDAVPFCRQLKTFR